MPENRNRSLQRQFRISEIKYDIQRLEVDLDSSIEQSQLIREAVNEKQHQLDRLQRRRSTSVTWEDEDNDD